MLLVQDCPAPSWISRSKSGDILIQTKPCVLSLNCERPSRSSCHKRTARKTTGKHCCRGKMPSRSTRSQPHSKHETQQKIVTTERRAPVVSPTGVLQDASPRAAVTGPDSGAGAPTTHMNSIRPFPSHCDDDRRQFPVESENRRILDRLRLRRDGDISGGIENRAP